MKSLISYFGCGYIAKSSTKPALEFSVYKFTDLYEKIMPFFKEHVVRGVKAEDFQDWCIALEIIKVKGHLTKDGLDKIIKIKAGMSKGRSL